MYRVYMESGEDSADYQELVRMREDVASKQCVMGQYCNTYCELHISDQERMMTSSPCALVVMYQYVV